MDPFIGQIMTVGFNFAPQGWATCAGQLLPVNQNQALFTLLGTTFGGNGQQTFGLPNLNGRMVVGTGQSAGTANYTWGQMSGSENVTLNQTQLPLHTHTATFAGTGSSFKASSTVQADSNAPVANSALGRTLDISSSGNAEPVIYTPAGAAVDMALAGLNVAGTVTVTPTGGSSPVPVLSPYLVLTTIIALQGIFPTRQ